MGKYRSNHADLGFFVTEIELKPNNKFHYKFSGDLQNTELDGKYELLDKTLYLKFDKLKGEADEGSIKIIGNDTIVDFSKLMNTHSYDLKTENGIEYHRKYRIKKNKLQSYHLETNRIVKTIKVYEDSKWLTKEYYLMKIN